MKNNELADIRKRMPAEWEGQEAVLMAWPHPDSDWGYIIDEARIQFARIIAAMLMHGENVLILSQEPETTIRCVSDYIRDHGFENIPDLNQHMIRMDHNDTWTRDYGPISLEIADSKRPVLLDFGFNAWGLKFRANLDNQVNARLKGKVFRTDAYVDCRDFILEGGSIETDGQGTLLTTTECLLNPNRNPTYTKEEIEKILSDRLGFDRYLWLDHGHIDGDDTDSHIDTLARLAPNDVICYSGGESEEMRLMEEQLMSFRTREGRPYDLVRLPEAAPIYDKGGVRMAATYANFLVTPTAVYVPTYAQPENDIEALKKISEIYSDRNVVGVDCTTLIKQGGSLHCSTMQLVPGTLINS